MSSRCKSASAAWPDNPAKQLRRDQRATACGVQRNVGSPPHSALVLTLLGPLHTPSDVPELMCMARRLQDAAAIAKDRPLPPRSSSGSRSTPWTTS
jgi:hypothetical protein